LPNETPKTIVQSFVRGLPVWTTLSYCDLAGPPCFVWAEPRTWETLANRNTWRCGKVARSGGAVSAGALSKTRSEAHEKLILLTSDRIILSGRPKAPSPPP
jgi:hypothetical protein